MATIESFFATRIYRAELGAVDAGRKEALDRRHGRL